MAYEKAKPQGRRSGSAEGQTGKTTRMVHGKDKEGFPKQRRTGSEGGCKGDVQPIPEDLPVTCLGSSSAAGVGGSAMWHPAEAKRGV